MMLKSAVKRLARRVAQTPPLPEVTLRRRARRSLTVLAYHRIGPTPAADYPFDDALFSATQEEFARELDYVRRHLDVISVSELARGLEASASGSGGKMALPERPALLTFDDGYRDNATLAAPILREAGLSACFFLCTHIIGTDAVPWWDQIACCFKHSRAAGVASPFSATDAPYPCSPEHRDRSAARFLTQFKQTAWPTALRCLAELRDRTGVVPEEYADTPLFMSWQEAASLVEQGMEVGGHTRTHPILSQIQDAEGLDWEVGGGARDLREELGVSPLAFAYPVGGDAMMSAQADDAIRRAGFQISFSYKHGFASRSPAAPWRLPRFHAEHGADFGAFRFELARAPHAPN